MSSPQFFAKHVRLVTYIKYEIPLNESIEETRTNIINLLNIFKNINGVSFTYYGCRSDYEVAPLLPLLSNMRYIRFCNVAITATIDNMPNLETFTVSGIIKVTIGDLPSIKELKIPYYGNMITGFVKIKGNISTVRSLRLVEYAEGLDIGSLKMLKKVIAHADNFKSFPKQIKYAEIDGHLGVDIPHDSELISLDIAAVKELPPLQHLRELRKAETGGSLHIPTMPALKKIHGFQHVSIDLQPELSYLSILYIDHLPVAPKLEELVIWNAEEINLAEINQYTGLKYLTLYGIKEMDAVLTLPNLIGLRCRYGTANSRMLSCLPQLTTLYMNRVEFDKSQLATPPYIPNLRVLETIECNMIPHAPLLQDLSIEKAKVSIQQVNVCKNLEVIKLNKVEFASSAICWPPSLKILNAYACTGEFVTFFIPYCKECSKVVDCHTSAAVQVINAANLYCKNPACSAAHMLAWLRYVHNSRIKS